ncbi:MAG: class I SAM-dependent methyltransferase [Acidimicrobiia bacterium]
MSEVEQWSRFKAAAYSFFNRNPKSNRLIVELAGLTPQDRTLDIGCGPGAAVREASRLVTEAVGVDPSPSMVEIAQKRSSEFPNVSFEVGSAEDLPFADGAFTVAWTVSAFHHWADEDAGLVEASRVLAQGGRLLIMERAGSGKHALSDGGAEELASDLERVGFVDAEVSHHKKEVVVAAAVPSEASS